MNYPPEAQNAPPVSPAPPAYPYYAYPPQPPTPPGPAGPAREYARRAYSRRERRLAAVCWGVGFLFWQWAAPPDGGLAALLWVAALLGTQLWFALREERQKGWWLPLCITGLFGIPFLLFDRGTLLDLDMAFLTLMGMMGIFWTYDSPRWDGADLLRGLLLRPIAAFTAGAGALFSGRKDRDREKKRISGVWWGLLAAVPVTLLVGVLLAAADEAFANLLSALTAPLREWGVAPFDLLLRVMLGIPAGLYLFGGFYGNRHRQGEILTDEAWERGIAATRLVSPAALLGAGIPVCVLYALFIFSQSAYYFSAFSGLLPESFTYAEYARRGFFELCAVAVINLLLLLAAGLFCRREEGRMPRSLRIWGAVLCGFTLLLIATALRKMALYIGEYGLTPLRVYTSWFMILLGVCFLILAICRFVPRWKPAKPLAAAFLLLFALLQFSGVNGRIADWNVVRYQAGDLKTVDVSLFYQLGDGAAPAAVKLLEDPDPAVAAEARAFLNARQTAWEQQTWRSFNLTAHRAKKAAEAAGIAPEQVLRVDLGEAEGPVYGVTCTWLLNGEARGSQSCLNANGAPLDRFVYFRFSEGELPRDPDPDRWSLVLTLSLSPRGEERAVSGEVDLSRRKNGIWAVRVWGDKTLGYAQSPD